MVVTTGFSSPNLLSELDLRPSLQLCVNILLRAWGDDGRVSRRLIGIPTGRTRFEVRVSLERKGSILGERKVLGPGSCVDRVFRYCKDHNVLSEQCVH